MPSGPTWRRATTRSTSRRSAVRSRRPEPKDSSTATARRSCRSCGSWHRHDCAARLGPPLRSSLRRGTRCDAREGPRLVSSHGERSARLLEFGGPTYAAQAGIRLVDKPTPLYQLLVTSLLLSARISADVAIAATRELREA